MGQSDSGSFGANIAFGVDTSLAQAALDRINQYRTQAGVAPATMHPALKASAENHVSYYIQNAPVSISIHDEQAGKPGFTGQDFFARTKATGYPNSDSTNEDIDTIANPVVAVDRFMATLNHRLPLLDPAYPDMGVGAGSNNGANPITVIDFGMPVWRDSYQPQFFCWPPENGTNFFRNYSGEGPDLFRRTGLNPVYPIGCPITLTYRGSGTITFDPNGMSLTDSNGNQVEAYKLNITEKVFWTARNTGTIAAVKPLNPDTTYQVTFTYSINGGPPQVRSWRFSTGATVSQEPFTPKAGLANADSAVRARWQAADGPVAAGTVQRSWLYGKDVFDARYEPYTEAPGGQRVVYYFDKARLEINNPNGDRNSQWFVTSGLLVKELVSGNVQLGDSKLENRGAAQVPVAGDPGPVNQACPTYASFLGLASLNNDRRLPNRTGQSISEFLNKDGSVSTLTTLPAPLSYGYYDNNLGHNIPDVLMRWMNNLPGGWLYVMGLPLAEAYWIKARVAGVEKDVLVQIFERRTLTFTPTNSPEWQVEMGNIGLHYFTWRYGG